MNSSAACLMDWTNLTFWQSDIDELADLSDDIRRARRRRIREMHRERTSLPPPPRPPPLERFPPRPRMLEEKRIREREWILDSRR